MREVEGLQSTNLRHSRVCVMGSRESGGDGVVVFFFFLFLVSGGGGMGCGVLVW